MSLIVAAAFVATLNYGATAPFALMPQQPYSQISDDPPTATSRPPQVLPAADQRFLSAAACDNLAALAALNLLSKRAQNAGLRDFARRVAQQRGRLQEALEVLAIRKDASLPTQPAPAARARLAKLDGLSGATLERAWLRRYGSLSRHTAALFTGARLEIRDAEVRHFAAEQALELRRLAEGQARVESLAQVVAGAD